MVKNGCQETRAAGAVARVMSAKKPAFGAVALGHGHGGAPRWEIGVAPVFGRVLGAMVKWPFWTRWPLLAILRFFGFWARKILAQAVLVPVLTR